MLFCSREFIYLEVKWENWIGQMFKYYHHNVLNWEYYTTPPNEREKKIWISKNIKDPIFDGKFMLLFSKYCVEHMNIIDDSSPLIKDAKELLYMIKYIHFQIDSTSKYTLSYIMETFIVMFTNDLIHKQNKVVTAPFLYFINKNRNRIRERRCIAAMTLNRIPGFDPHINSSIIQYLM